MFILDQIHAREFSTQFIADMEDVYYNLFKGTYNSDALMTHLYFM